MDTPKPHTATRELWTTEEGQADCQNKRFPIFEVPLPISIVELKHRVVLVLDCSGKYIKGLYRLRKSWDAQC